MTKYQPLPKVKLPDRKWPDNHITKAPIWCSVDLRDGNQALAVPMSIEKKIDYFKLLLEIGFKEIEVGFPSASQIEFDFIREIIDEGLIPDDVTIQVLTQAREHLIKRTFESLQGAKNVIVHLYNSTSPLQRKVTFNMSKEEIKEIAINGTKVVKGLLPMLPDSNVRLEYSPESFSDTEVDYALEVCEAVMDVWEPTGKDKIIINLPHTVEWFSPNYYADMIEWFCENMKEREKAIISIHAHNDRGTGIAASELGMMAGAERVEGTLFGNGERTGNLDVVTMALNMFAEGVDPKLDFSNLPKIREVFEACTEMEVPPRHPYSGDLVFTAFSGSHQDAIKKGLDRIRNNNDENVRWEVPYLPIDPKDVGRAYSAIIRINSQSGKGGVAYIMSRDFGYELPKKMHPEFGVIANVLADTLGRELAPQEIFDLFSKEYLKKTKPLELLDFETIINHNDEAASCSAKIKYNENVFDIEGRGNGPLDAFVHALKENNIGDFNIIDFHEQSLSSGSGAEAISYILIRFDDNKELWGAGIDTDISKAGVKSIISAFNRMS